MIAGTNQKDLTFSKLQCERKNVSGCSESTVKLHRKPQAPKQSPPNPIRGHVFETRMTSLADAETFHCPEDYDFRPIASVHVLLKKVHDSSHSATTSFSPIHNPKYAKAWISKYFANIYSKSAFMNLFRNGISKCNKNPSIKYMMRFL